MMLYIEDEESDVLLLRLALELGGVSCRLASVSDGEQAIKYLSGTEPFSDRERYPLPALVLLDLNLPRESGFEVLAWIRQQSQFCSLPVIVYTSSLNAADRERARLLGASDYLLKLSSLDKIADLARELARRWLAQLPC